MRLDRALRADLVTAMRSGPVRLFLALQVLAALTFIWRRGSGTLSMVLLIWLALSVLAFVAWWAGRHRLARPQADAVPAARAKAIFALVGVAGLTVWGSGLAGEVGLVLCACGIGGWSWAAWRSRGGPGLRRLLLRDPRPFVPLLLLVAMPRLLAIGPVMLTGVLVALPSGIGQQLLYLLGLYAPLEAATGRPDAAAVLAALLFGLLHLPLVMPDQQGDAIAAAANVLLFQASVGLVACLAFQRHRAVVPIGVAHALAIA